MQASPSGRFISWALLIALGLANVAGYGFDLYQRFWWFDRVLHGGTIFAITTWLALVLFAPAFEHGRPVLVAILIASAGIAAGALWEVVEWGFDQLNSADVIKGKNDTILDIVMDSAGAGLASIASTILLRSYEEE